MSEATYTVWVGGTEVTDYYLTKEVANQIADVFVANGYTDVQVRKEYK